jgi:hypothetical protein
MWEDSPLNGAGLASDFPDPRFGGVVCPWRSVPPLQGSRPLLLLSSEAQLQTTQPSPWEWATTRIEDFNGPRRATGILMTRNRFSHYYGAATRPANDESRSPWRSEPPELRWEKMNGGVVALIQGIVGPELSELPIPPGHVSFQGTEAAFWPREQSAVGTREKVWE